MFLLRIFTNLWFGGKCLLINLMNILPILVLTDLLYGGLNQIMLRFLFFLFCFLLVVDIVAWFYVHWNPRWSKYYPIQSLLFLHESFWNKNLRENCLIHKIFAKNIKKVLRKLSMNIRQVCSEHFCEWKIFSIRRKIFTILSSFFAHF